ncbi:Codeine O-demethylase, partial [Mucuna pruriens]
MSNGLYKSVEHRATVNSTKERISIAMFFVPKIESEIGPAASLTGPENPPLYKNIKVEKYVKDFFSRKLDGKSYLEHLKITDENSTNAIE